MNLTSRQALTCISRVTRQPWMQSHILPSSVYPVNRVSPIHTTVCTCNASDNTPKSKEEAAYDPHKYGQNTVRDPHLRHGPIEALGNTKHLVAPTNFQKYILLWVKEYNKMADIPEKINLSKMNMSKDIARIKILFYMFFATFVACGFTIRYGKELRASGKNIDLAEELKILEMRVAYLREQKAARLQKEQEGMLTSAAKS